MTNMINDLKKLQLLYYGKWKRVSSPIDTKCKFCNTGQRITTFREYVPPNELHTTDCPRVDFLLTHLGKRFDNHYYPIADSDEYLIQFNGWQSRDDDGNLIWRNK